MISTVDSTPPFTLVVGNDFSPASGYAFDQAARIARRIPGSDLHVLHVVAGEPNHERSTQLANQLRLYLEEKAHALGGLERQAIAVHVRSGDAVRELAVFASDTAADLIVVGARKGSHLAHLFLGSVAGHLLEAAPCPVFVAGPMPERAADAQDPVLQPACSDCLVARRATAGRAWWCARHAEHHAKAHSYSFRRELSLRTHDSAVTPTGADAV